MEQAVVIVCQGHNETWQKRTDAALVIAGLFEAWLSGPPPAHEQAVAKRAAA